MRRSKWKILAETNKIGERKIASSGLSVHCQCEFSVSYFDDLNYDSIEVLLQIPFHCISSKWDTLSKIEGITAVNKHTLRSIVYTIVVGRQVFLMCSLSDYVMYTLINLQHQKRNLHDVYQINCITFKGNSLPTYTSQTGLAAKTFL